MPCGCRISNPEVFSPEQARERAGWPPLVKEPICRFMMLDLTEEEIAALARLLRRTIDDDRYPLSRRIQMLKAILAKIRPETVRKPLPPLKHYEPPRAMTTRRRRSGR
jgi:hypothetical protein